MPILGLVLAVGTAGMTMGVDLTGGKWQPSFMTQVEIPAGVHMNVQFGPDGRITGYGGCNRFFGGYTISGDQISIGPLGSTRKGCPGITQIETSFFSTLQAAKSFTQDDTTLTLFDAAGGKLAQFVRAAEK
jgi:heat shock protein HslJ